MRISPLLVTITLLLPLASALMLPLEIPAAEVPPLPADIPDAEVLMLLGPTLGLAPARVPLRLDASADLPTLVDRLATRAGATMGEDDLARFAALDARLAAPTLTLLLAVEQAWDMRDTVFTPERAADAPLADEELETLLNAAIMLSDTIESVVIPQLEAAAQSDAWPADAVADPVGILRIGGTGNDKENIDRLVQLDARGDDWYYNNAGASQLASDFDPETLDYPVSVHIDLAGNDRYRENQSTSMGAGYQGIGVFYEISGNDQYYCPQYCMGGATAGVGTMRDADGHDIYIARNSLGYASNGLGYNRDDAGDDTRNGSIGVGGYSTGEGVGLLWDRSGIDKYYSLIGDNRLWGFTAGKGHAWFVDETDSVDIWQDLTGRNLPPMHACNDCEWEAGYPEELGRGNDNRGGLAYLIGTQER